MDKITITAELYPKAALQDPFELWLALRRADKALDDLIPNNPDAMSHYHELRVQIYNALHGIK